MREFNNGKPYHAEDIFLKNGKANWDAFCDYITTLIQEHFWSPENPERKRIKRIFFKHARESKSFFSEEFNKPGCYIFGVHKKILYVGMTTTTLWKRLGGRYFKGDDSKQTRKILQQYELAKKYEQSLIEKGIDGFPPEVIAEYRRQYGGIVRLKHAVWFAREGIDKVWFHLLPVASVDHISTLEEILKQFCNTWNERHGFERIWNER